MYLNGDAQLALDGAGGLRENGKMGRTTTTSHRPATSMEQHQGHIVLVSHLHQVFLHPQPPLCQDVLSPAGNVTITMSS